MLRQLPFAILRCILLCVILVITACSEDDGYEEPPTTVDPTDDDPVDDGNTGGENETLVVFNPAEVPYQNLSAVAASLPAQSQRAKSVPASSAG